jgi:2-dehydropantoate 2-reductase
MEGRYWSGEMRVLIWGAGAIGGTIGAWLARARHEIVLVDLARDHIDAIKQRGLTINGPVDEFNISIPAYTPDTLNGVFETILLCVKAQDTAEAAQALLPHLAPDGVVVSVQNGLNELTLSKIIGKQRVIGAFVNFGADYLEPGVITRGNRAAVVIGELDGQITPRVQALHRLLLDFDDQAVLTTNIWGYLWGKLAYGAQLFATALTNDSIADSLALPEYRPIYIGLAREVLTVAHQHGITPEAFNGFNPNAFMPGETDAVAQQSLDEMVTFNRGSSKTHSGIWRDLVVRKRRTEIDAQLGMVVEIAHEAGIETPLLSALIDLIHDIENGTRDLSRTNLDILLDLIDSIDTQLKDNP